MILLVLLLQVPILSIVWAVDDIYTVRVPIDQSDGDAVNVAYRNALISVLIRVTGSSDALMISDMDTLFPNPARYVLRFRSLPEEKLEVSFDGDAVEKALKHSGLPIWGSDRPLTLVWLAVDWGNGERVVVAADESSLTSDATRSIDRNRLLRERVEHAAATRGVPVAFPLLDTEDLQSVSFSDIWGGFDQRILEASRRYAANSVLIGRIRPDSPQQNRWTYHIGGDRMTWNGEPELVVNLLADQLASLFAISGDAVLQQFDVRVSGVDSIVAYGEIQRMLETTDMIENFQLMSVAGTQAKYSISIYGNWQKLQKAIELDGTLQQSLDDFDTYPENTGLLGPSLTFEYRP